MPVEVVPTDVYIPDLPVAVHDAPSPYPSQGGSYVDDAGNTLLRITEASHATTGAGYNSANVPATWIGMNYVYRYIETVDQSYIVVPMVTKTGQSFSFYWDVHTYSTKALASKMLGQADGVLSNNTSTPTRRYYIGYNSGALDQLRYDTLPSSAGDTLVATFTGYQNVGTFGERRQSDGNSERMAYVATRTDATGVDILVVELSSGTIVKTISFTGWTANTGGSNDIRACAINHDGTKVAVMIGASNGSLSPLAYSGTLYVAFFDCSGTPTYTGRTPGHTSNHGDWVVRTDGQEGWCTAWMGQYNSGTGIWDDVYGTVGASASFIAWFPTNYNPASSGSAPTVMLDVASTGAACYVSGQFPGRIMLMWGDDSASIYGGDDTSKMYLRVIDLKADGSMYGSVRALYQMAWAAMPYEGLPRAVYGRDRKRVYVNLGADATTAVHLWLSTRLEGAGLAHIRKSGLLGGHNVTSGSDSYTFPDLPPAGRLLVARFSSWRGGGGAGAFTVTDNKGSTWTVNQYSFADVGIDNRRIGIAYLRVPSGWTGTYTVTISTTLGYSSFSATISEYSEIVASGDPLDQIARAYGTLNTSLTVTSGTTSQATELVCTALDLEYWADTDANIVAPSGYTMRDVNDDWNAGTVFGSADKEVSSTGAQAPVWTFDSAILMIGVIATFKKATSSSTPTNEITGGGAISFGDVYSPIVSFSEAPPTTASTGTTHTITAVATDDLGIGTFVLKKNGTTVATSSVSTVSYTWTLTTESGAVQWQAVATDTAANSTTAFATTTVSNDITVPTITLSASDTLIEAASEQSTLTAIASDNTGVASVKFYKGAPGSGTLLSTVTSAPYRHVLAFTRADNGSQSYYAAATDAAGNVTNSAVVTIAVSIADVLSLAVMSVINVVAPAGDSIGWSLLLTQNGVPLSGVTVSASSNQTWFDLDSATDETDQNGVAVFTGTIDPEAENDDAATVTFTYSTASASATVTVNDGPSNWITIVRNSTVWVRIPRDTLE